MVNRKNDGREIIAKVRDFGHYDGYAKSILSIHPDMTSKKDAQAHCCGFTHGELGTLAIGIAD